MEKTIFKVSQYQPPMSHIPNFGDAVSFVGDASVGNAHLPCEGIAPLPLNMQMIFKERLSTDHLIYISF
jgi:hypothetical protein